MPGFNYYMLSDIGGRKENQDFVLTQKTNYGFVMIVCDGMGGANGGRLASKTAATTIADFFANHKVSNIEDERSYFINLLEEAVVMANNKVYELSQTPGLQGMGTTACIILLRGSKAYFGHVGDSRIYHLHEKQYRHTEDHSKVFQLFKASVLTKEEAREHPQSNVITRALGIGPAVNGTFEEVDVTVGNRFILCTDGIWGVYPEDILIKQFNSDVDLKELCEVLIQNINEKYDKEERRHDNLSLGIIDITDTNLTSYTDIDLEIAEPKKELNNSINEQVINKIVSKRKLKSHHIIIGAILLGIIILLLWKGKGFL